MIKLQIFLMEFFALYLSEKVTSLANISSYEKVPVKAILGVKFIFYIANGNSIIVMNILE